MAAGARVGAQLIDFIEKLSGLPAELSKEEHTGGTVCILDATATGARRLFDDTEVSGLLAGGTVDRHFGGVDDTFETARGVADIV